jgi:hypothetical protein
LGPPQPEGAIDVADALGLEMMRDGASHRLSPRDAFPPADCIERLELFLREIDDGAHDVIILRHQMRRAGCRTVSGQGQKLDPLLEGPGPRVTAR